MAVRGVERKRESRIFEFCERKAEEIIAELNTSGGDHGEDVEVLEGLIETWRALRESAEGDGE